MRVFELVASAKSGTRSAEPAAVLAWDEVKDGWDIHITPGLPPSAYPADLYPYVLAKRWSLDGPDAMDYIRGRVTPAERQNIAEILGDLGLDEWDASRMFILAGGRWSQDDFEIRDVGTRCIDR